MRCEIQLDKFKQAVSLAERVAGRNTNLPVLSCILLEIGTTSIKIRSTNLDVGIEVDVPAKSDTEGTFAVPARTISSFLAQASDRDQIARLEMAGGNLILVVAKSRGVIKTVPPDDFPAIPAVNDGKPIQAPTEAFIKGFRSVWYSASVSNVKPELSSIYIYKDGETAIFVATDSFRLAEKRVTLPKGASIEDMLIPFKNTIEIVKMLETAGPTVSVRSNKNLVSFEANGTRITSRIIDGVFPDYRQIIPKSFTTEAVMLKQDLVNALKVSNVFSDSFNQIHITVDPKKKLFQLDTKNNDVGENSSMLDAAITGEPVEINFNSKYVSDSFQAIDADSVSLQFNGRNKPLVVRPVSGDQTFMYLVMPMNR